ncbi:putative transcription regulator PAB1642 [Aspergillus foveolatus]|uniref:putative transcription regulator PAB1642 n=1 Tax=Aspergillus foveolatus TaxID=210207 RepID=UPI003CCCBA1A
MKLTAHLSSTTPAALQSATTHPFLRHAGSGTLPKTTLAAWLSQDRLYAQTYVRFIGLLLSKVHLPNTPSKQNNPSITEKILEILIDALNNIHRELQFFEDVARGYGLDLNTNTPQEESDPEVQRKFAPAPITQGYIDMFLSAASPGNSLLEGLVVLWATEVCYLKAWRYAADFLQKSAGAGNRSEEDGGALREKFIPNWASDEFEEFVNKIGDVVDEFARQELGEELREGAEGLDRCERWWRQVVWLEERFWPHVQE